MIDPEDNQNTFLTRRTTTEEPSRKFQHFLIGRPLSTATSEHEAIGKAVGRICLRRFFLHGLRNAGDACYPALFKQV